MQTSFVTKRREPRADWSILILLFLVAWALRMIGIDWGYWHGDERVNQAAQVLAGELIPDQHFYPPFIYYVTAIWYGALYAVGSLTGIWSGTAEFRAQYFQDPTVFYLTARALTGALSALMAPLFYRIGVVLGFTRWESFCIALFAVFAPISIYLSYIFKGDLGVATATIMTILLMILKAQNPARRRLDIWLGVAVVLGLSFKHSFVFLMLPYALVYLLVVSLQGSLMQAFSSVARIILTVLILWPILNVGIVLDFANFLTFQEIQSVMSIAAPGQFLNGLGLMARTAMDWQIGITLLMPYAFLLLPLFAVGMDRPWMLLGIWLTTILSMVFVAYLVGMRQPEQLWISHFMVLQLFGALSIACVFRLSRTVGTLVGAVALAFCVIGDISIWQQTLVRPLKDDVASYLTTVHPERRVMSSIDLPVLQSRLAQDYELARTARTAAKYAIEIPEVAPERRVPETLENAYFIVSTPTVMFGLEGSTDADLDGKIAPFAWPPQEANWNLDALISDGIDLFVISNLEWGVKNDAAPVLQAFYLDLSKRCRPVQVFLSRKPLFLERDTTVMECRQAG